MCVPSVEGEMERKESRWKRFFRGGCRVGKPLLEIETEGSRDYQALNLEIGHSVPRKPSPSTDVQQVQEP